MVFLRNSHVTFKRYLSSAYYTLRPPSKQLELEMGENMSELQDGTLENDMPITENGMPITENDMLHKGKGSSVRTARLYPKEDRVGFQIGSL